MDVWTKRGLVTNGVLLAIRHATRRCAECGFRIEESRVRAPEQEDPVRGAPLAAIAAATDRNGRRRRAAAVPPLREQPLRFGAKEASRDLVCPRDPERALRLVMRVPIPEGLHIEIEML